MKWRMALVAWVVCLSSLHATNGMSPIGYSVKSKGMGGASVALPLDSFVVATNPAGLIDLGCRLDVELSYTFQNAFYHGEQAASPAPVTLTSTSNHGLWWPAIGIAAQINSCSSIGIAAYTLGANDMAWDPPLLFLGNPFVAGNPDSHTSMQNYYIAITPAYAWRYCSSQSFGVSASVVFGSTLIKGVSILRSESQLPAYVTDNGDDTSIGVNLRIGWIGDFFCDTLRVGASVVSKTYMSRFTKYQGVIGDYGAFQWPWSADIGFAWFFCPCWVLALDYRYIQWKSNDGMYFSNFVNQDNRGDVTRGLWDGQGFGWNNQSVVRLGLAWTPLRCLTLRGGYNYGTQVIPASEMLLAPLTGAVIKHHATLGLTFTTCIGELSAYYAHGFRRSAHNVGSLQPSSDPGDSVSLRNEQNDVGIAWGTCF